MLPATQAKTPEQPPRGYRRFSINIRLLLTHQLDTVSDVNVFQSKRDHAGSGRRGHTNDYDFAHRSARKLAFIDLRSTLCPTATQNATLVLGLLRLRILAYGGIK